MLLVCCRLQLNECNSQPSEEGSHERNKVIILGGLGQTKIATSLCNIGPELIYEGSPANMGSTSGDKDIPLDCLSEEASERITTKANSAPHLPGSKQHRSPKSAVKSVTEHSCPDMKRKGQLADESSRSYSSFLLLCYIFVWIDNLSWAYVLLVISYTSIFIISRYCYSEIDRLKDDNPEQGRSGNSSIGLRKIIGLMRSPKFDRAVAANNKQKKIKVCELQNN